MAAHTKVIPNNCVSVIKVPQVGSVFGVDYNPVLGLYATFDDHDPHNHSAGEVFIWNPVNGKVVAKCSEYASYVLFVPGNRLAVYSYNIVSSYREPTRGIIEIFNLEKIKAYSTEFVKRDEVNDKIEEGQEENDEDDEEEHLKAEIIIDDRDLPLPYPGELALSPGGNLLVTDSAEDSPVYEIFIDWDNSKFLKSREIFPEDDEEYYAGIRVLRCSLNSEVQIAVFSFETPMLVCTTVSLNSKGDVETSKQEKITYYMLNGEEKFLKDHDGLLTLLHDGQNLIIGNDEGEIVLLESMMEGSTAHLIASGVELSGQMRLNHEGQLMVCEEKVIKLFDYKCEPKSLLELCRSHFRKSICTGYTEKVNSLEIPSVLKKYLLFKYN